MFYNRWFKSFVILAVIVLMAVGANAVSVKDFGAVGDGNSDCTEAFKKAALADKDIYVPAGVYLIKTVDLPENIYMHGAGNSSVIKFQHEKEGSYAVGIGSGSRISNLYFTATKPYVDWLSPAGSQVTGILRINNAKNVSIDQVTVNNYRHMGIWITQSEGIKISNCRLEKLDLAILIEFSRQVQVTGNTVIDIADHGIEFWGNLKFEQKTSSDLIFANNYVYKGGGGGIWGAGAKRVTMTGNIVDEAKDICLDLEWCDDSIISGNTVRGGWNAGIALFFTCANVSITGNTVVITDGRQGRRDGIWLTGTNKMTFKDDSGHKNVSITGNTVIAADGRPKHGINIGSGSNITCAANVLSNADTLDRTAPGNVKFIGDSASSASAETLADIMTVLSMSQEWKFQTDPNDEGVKKEWFSADFDTKGWSSIRSDKNGDGWEAQGFAGENGKGYTGYAWYRAELPSLPAKLRTFRYVNFDMVDEQAWIYLNGVKVGEHSVESESREINSLWNEPFGVDISQYLKTEGSNILVVRVHNGALHGGVRGPVYIIMSDAPANLSEQRNAIKVLAKP